MKTTPNGWKIFDLETPVLSYEYSFGAGTAHTLAVGTGDGLIVISPPCNVSPAVMDDLSRFGSVRALVAPNGFHHMGLASWKQRFPDAPLFAPAQAIARVAKQTGLSGIRPLAEASLTGPKLELIDMPHFKLGEALVRIQSGRGLVWHVTDVLVNLPELPSHPLAWLAFKLSGSAPGLRFNNLAGLIAVKDKKALKQWLTAQIDATAPSWLIPSHGDVVDLSQNLPALRQALATGR